MSESTPQAAGGPSGRSFDRLRDSARIGWLVRYPSTVVVVGMLILARVVYEGFYDWNNIANLLAQNAGLALVSVGMTYVIITGAFDLSVGAILGAGAVIFARLDVQASVLVAVPVCALFGATAGAGNGLLVTRLRINPFVATLGTASVITGLATLLAGKQALLVNSDAFQALGTARILSLTPPVWIAFAVTIVAAVVLARTVYGRNLYAIGGNEEAARIAGIRVGLHRASVFVIVGCLSAIAGLALAAQVGTAQANFGVSMALDAIAVVVIGGTSLRGGEGAIWRSVVGLAILAILNNIFQSLAFEPAIQQIIKGAIVIGAVGFDAWIAARKER